MPGKFDLLGASHQLFHTCVVIAAYIHYRWVGGPPPPPPRVGRAPLRSTGSWN